MSTNDDGDFLTDHWKSWCEAKDRLRKPQIPCWQCRKKQTCCISADCSNAKRIWRFPEIGVPLVFIHFDRIFHHKPSIHGVAPWRAGNPHLVWDSGFHPVSRTASFESYWWSGESSCVQLLFLLSLPFSSCAMRLGSSLYCFLCLFANM